ncbi:hypothetical protein B0H12DRAFT_205587 [Mycena haematopus]|nr:hypothetical protein B0H12DRAFT_205587 [Mycena haematopus]
MTDGGTARTRTRVWCAASEEARHGLFAFRSTNHEGERRRASPGLSTSALRRIKRAQLCTPMVWRAAVSLLQRVRAGCPLLNFWLSSRRRRRRSASALPFHLPGIPPTALSLTRAAKRTPTLRYPHPRAPSPRRVRGIPERRDGVRVRVRWMPPSMYLLPHPYHTATSSTTSSTTVSTTPSPADSEHHEQQRPYASQASPPGAARGEDGGCSRRGCELRGRDHRLSEIACLPHRPCHVTSASALAFHGNSLGSTVLLDSTSSPLMRVRFRTSCGAVVGCTLDVHLHRLHSSPADSEHHEQQRPYA